MPSSEIHNDAAHELHLEVLAAIARRVIGKRGKDKLTPNEVLQVLACSAVDIVESISGDRMVPLVWFIERVVEEAGQRGVQLSMYRFDKET